MTALDDPSKVIHKPAGLFMGPLGEERVGDVSNVLFTNGWIADDDGRVFIYYASSDTRMHVATSSIERLRGLLHEQPGRTASGQPPLSGPSMSWWTATRLLNKSDLKNP